jgi:N-acetylglucosaminyl-diphospho-decaprenol L-rhamnosyltransferase
MPPGAVQAGRLGATMTPVPPLVSVLLASWNNRDFMARSLESVPTDAELIIVDHGSTDGSADEAARLRPDARIERLTSEGGFAAGLNHAARLATGRYLLLLDADAEATPKSIDRLVEHLEAHPQAGGAVGRLLSMTEEPQSDAIGRLPTLGGLAADLLLVSQIWPTNPVTRHARAADVDRSGPGTVERAAATGLLVRRELFEELNGFDERFSPAWFDDVDLCHRLRDAGRTLAYLPSAAFRHQGGSAARALGATRHQRLYYRNLERYVRKHHGVIGAAGIKILIVAGISLRMLGSLLRADRESMRAFGGVLSGTLGGWRHA